MRMFRFSSWISESRGGEEAVNGGTTAPLKAAIMQSPKTITVDSAETTKRKRSESCDVAIISQPSTPTAKRRKEDKTDDTFRVNVQNTNQDIKKETKILKMVKDDVSQDTLRQTIESQLSLEIVLKHDELRLINQEIAKCQIALEQLRRCHLIPFPTATGAQSSMMDVSSGTGDAIIPPQGENRPQWAPAYGVTDGPYTRHYARWLIPDPRFDGMQPEWERGSERTRAGLHIAEGGRTTRHSFAEGSTPGSKLRTHRGSSGQKLQALPSGYTQSKENAGPSILKRADGQMVKLVCIDCRRENFGSTQGFINHCRIAHRREFKSHEEAAVQSGQPIEVDEVGGIVGEERTPSVATGLVHSLIRNAPTDPGAYTALLSRINASLEMYRQGQLPGITSIPGALLSAPQSENFIASSETPFLSNLMRSKGFGGNLDEIVVEAKQLVDLDGFSSQGEESDSERPPTPSHLGPSNLDGSSDSPLPAMRVPARAAMSPAPLGRPTSSKGPEGRNGRKLGGQSGISPRLPYATPINITTALNHNKPPPEVSGIQDHDRHSEDPDQDILMDDGPSIIDLSPNTVASNNAPSLVSDDGEYDEVDDDGESSLGHSDAGDEGSDVAEIELEDDAMEKVVPRTALRHRAVSGALRKEDKHVTFVSPVKESGRERRNKK